jgi:hypothetical protein
MMLSDNKLKDNTKPNERLFLRTKGYVKTFSSNDSMLSENMRSDNILSSNKMLFDNLTPHDSTMFSVNIY